LLPAVVGIPDRVLVFSLCALFATSVTVQANFFHPYTALPLMLLLIALTWRMMPAPLISDATVLGQSRAQRVRSVSGRTTLVSTVVVLLLILVWVAVQRNYFSELLSVRRDPSIYTLRGIWLINHPSPDFTVSDQLLRITRDTPQAGLDFGVETYDHTRYFQSTTVVPGLIAIAGWLGGIPLLLKADIFIGGFVLLSVYAVARRMAGPVLGLVPVVALGLCMPMVAFTRVSYTEPLSIIAVMACLLGLWQGVLSGRRSMWLLAGIGAGCVAICRIDGWIVVLGAVVGIGIWGAFATSLAVRRKVIASLGWFLLTAVPVAALGATDLILHSPYYLRILLPSFGPLVAVVFAVIIAAVLVTVLPGLPRIAMFVAARPKATVRVSVIGIALAIVLVMLRPLFYQARNILDAATQHVEIGRQKAQGLPIDPARSYDEHSVNWIAWYLGWPAVILASLAVLWAIRVAIRKRRAELVVVIAVVAVNAALYLNDVSISPDQVWAMRRFLPVILPGGLLILAWGLAELWDRRASIESRLLPRRSAGGKSKIARSVIAVLAAVLALYPLTTWNPTLFSSREGAGQYDFVQRICAHVANQKVLLVGHIPQMGFYQPTLRNICNSSVVTLPASTPELERQQIARVRLLWGPGPIKVAAFFEEDVPWSTLPDRPWFITNYSMWITLLQERPAAVEFEATQVWLGTAQADGSVVPE